MNSSKRIASRTLLLPGNVVYTVIGGDVPQPPTWDHPTVRGDLSLTTDANGRQLGELYTYTPYGEPITTTGAVNPDNVPDNQPGHMDYGWLGQHQRPYEHAGALSLVQMGARPYSPALGRFLSVDPIDGGSANDYDYTNADPINATDLDGLWPSWIKNAWNGVKKAGRAVKKAAKWARAKVRQAAKWAGRKIASAARWVARQAKNAWGVAKIWWKKTGRLRVRGCLTKGLAGFRFVTTGGYLAKFGGAAIGCLVGLIRYY